MFLERPYRSLRVDLFLFSGVPWTPLWITTCWSIVIFGCFFDAPVDHYLLICLTFLWGLNLEDIWRLLPDVSLTKCNSVTCTRIDEKAAWGFDPNVGGGSVTPDVSNVYKRGRRTCESAFTQLRICAAGCVGVPMDVRPWQAVRGRRRTLREGGAEQQQQTRASTLSYTRASLFQCDARLIYHLCYE